MRPLALILGSLASTIAVAWGIAAWSPRQAPRTTDPDLVRHPFVRDWPTEGVSWCSTESFGLSVIVARYLLETQAQGVGWECSVYSAGFPMRCLYGTFRPWVPNPNSPLSPLPRTTSLIEHGIPIPRSLSATPLTTPCPSRFLPIRPIWSGLAVNTTVAAAVLYAALRAASAARSLRREIRHRQGCCAQCGHRLAGSARCPECGLAARSRVTHEAG